MAGGDTITRVLDLAQAALEEPTLGANGPAPRAWLDERAARPGPG